MTTRGDLLIVDDNERVFKSLAINFRRNGFSCLWAADSRSALRLAGTHSLAAAVLDLSLGSESGLDLMRDLARVRPRLPVVFISGFGTLEAAVLAMKMGAFDFLPKPLDFKRLLDVVNNAIAGSPPEEEAGAEPVGMVAASPEMRELLERAARAADSDIPVLITGESGTGKELLAEYIHAQSSRRARPLVRVNCSAITDSLAESELFGHVKGAFTGADADHPGFFEQADRGTLHLDEIGDMPLPIQAKMLRVLESSRVRVLGGTREIPVDVRIIASTNHDLAALTDQGLFRTDLYYRINPLQLHLPPLRERRADIPALLRRFLATQPGGEGKRFSVEAEKLLHAHDWPGNIREMKNVVKVSSLLTPGSVIEADDLPRAFRDREKRDCRPGGSSTCVTRRLDETERNAIQSVLDDVGGNRRLASERLGISVRSLYYKLERYGLS